MPFATAAFNTKSKIKVLILDLSPHQNVDLYAIKLKIKVVFNLRERIFEEPFYRLVDARTDGLFGLIIERYIDIRVIRS